MSARGRDRGGHGGGNSFNREQLASMGVAPGENLPGPIEPPLLYPPLNRKPIPLRESLEVDYLLILKDKPQQEIDKLLAQLSSVKEKFDWQLFPAELRLKVVAKKMKMKDVKPVDIDLD